MASKKESDRLVTGAVDFSGGVDSSRVRTIASAANPNGLQPNQLAWLINSTVREGCISPRPGWKYLTTMPFTDNYQCGYMYHPDFDLPYIIAQIGGRTFRIRVDTDNSVEEITIAGDQNSAGLPQSWMEQAQQFLVIQDDSNVPLVWNGVILQRVTSMLNASPKIPTGSAMCFYQGRLWIAQGRAWLGSDISPSIPPGGSGTAAYDYRDACLSVVENVYLSGLKRFVTSTVSGNIRALKFPTNLNTALGEGDLQIFTRSQIYSMNVPVVRADWAALTDPKQRVVQINYGTTGDRSVVNVNGDLFFQATDGIRSLLQKTRDWNEYGNTPQSREVQRILQFNDRALLRYGTGTEADNRLIESCLPFQTPVGVAHKADVVMNFDLVSTISKKLPPVWEGSWEGLDILQRFTGDFGGLFRTFALVLGRTSRQIEVWEQVPGQQEDQGPDGDNRITWVIETPSYTWGSPLQLKNLDTLKLWVDRMFGTVDFKLYYRPDQYPCWVFWHAWQECAARSNCELESVGESCDYPTQTYCPQYRTPMTMPKPHFQCDATNDRPTSLGYSFQFRFVIKGYCRVRGIFPYALPKDEAPYDGIVCGSESGPTPPPTPPTVKAILDAQSNALLDANGNAIIQA